MNTLKTDFRVDRKRVKLMFQELFLIQLQLEQLNDEQLWFYHQVRTLIQRIDDLMEMLIEVYTVLGS